MRASILPAAWLAATIVAAAPTYSTALAALNAASNLLDPQTKIYAENTTEFINATERWTEYDPPTFVISVSPATEADVATVVAVARSIDLPFLATGGRHGTSITLNNLQNGLAIDLSQLDSISVDSSAGTATIGGGLRFQSVYDPVYEAGYEIQIGSCSCPGMVGATIGAGVGRLQGLDGLVIDALVSVRLVTANGSIVEASETVNAELFWGIRGAGANFGIITVATYKLTPLHNGGQVTNVDLIFGAASNASYFEVLASFEGNMPAELAIITDIVYNATAGATEILTNWVYFGSEDEALDVMAPVFALGPLVSAVSVVPWNKLVTTAGFGLNAETCIPGVVRSGYGANAKQLSAPTYTELFSKMDAFYQEYPAAQGSTVEIELFATQAMTAVPDNATAYPWRDALAYFLIDFTWTDSSVEEASNDMAKEIRSDIVATSGYDQLAVYVSYAHGDETLEQMFGVDKLPRLAALKRTWDPENVFSFYHALPMQYP